MANNFSGIHGGGLSSNGRRIDPLYGQFNPLDPYGNSIELNNIQKPMSVKLEFTKIMFSDNSQIGDIYLDYEGSSDKQEAIMELNKLIHDNRVMLFRTVKENKDMFINCGYIKLYVLK